MTRAAHIILALCICVPIFSQQTLRIMSYNVENLFYPEADTTREDLEFIPAGTRHWSFTRYRNKLAHIAEVIANAGGWTSPAIVGLQEVEEARCLDDLCTYQLRSHRYRYVLFEGPDTRGIDVGLLYDTAQVTLLAARALPVPMPPGDRPTRDVLYTCFQIQDSGGGWQDSLLLHVFTCHLPSQLGGAKVSGPRREAVYAVLRAQTDSLLLLDPQSRIVMMGDFNATPLDALPPLTNLMLPFAARQQGTEKYRGEWSCLDQFFVSPALLDEVKASIFDADFLLEPDEAWLGRRPKRTYQGFHYQKDGYSDHLPIVLEWTTELP